MSSKKWNLVLELDRIASSYTHTTRPRSALLDPSEIPNAEAQIVLKREGSAYHDHVLYVQQEAHKKVQRVLRQPTHGYRWIKQEFIPQLRLWGEYRVYIVCGHIVSVVGTRPMPAKPGILYVSGVTQFYSLERLR